MRTDTRRIKTRDDLRLDTVYVDEETDEALVTPDGVGIYYYEIEEDALEEWGVEFFDAFLIPHEIFQALVNDEPIGG